MSQKNETTILVLALLITLGLAGGGGWWLANRGFKIGDVSTPTETTPIDGSVQNRISLGEKILIPQAASPAKRAGVEAIAAGTYDKAIANLQAALRINRNDPEALIFLNNAQIGQQKSYTIAASVPIGTDPNVSLEILRGVAQAQNEVNSSRGIKGIPLRVAIANDDDNPAVGKQIATALVNNPDVLGVVGPNASDTTLAAGTAYQSGGLVAISPTSTSVKLSGFSHYIFRTVPSDYVAARALANHMLTKLQQKNAVVYFNSKSGYSQSLKSEFVTAVSLGGGQVLSEFDLSDPGFSAAQSVNQATKQGAQVLMFATNVDELDKVLQVVQLNRKRLKLLGGDDIYTSKTLEIGQDAAAGMVLAVPWDIQGTPTSAILRQSIFPRESRQLWGADVNWRTALAYDATLAFVAAIEQNPTRSGIQQALSSPDFSTTGASGIIRFLASGDRNASVQLVKIVPGNRSHTGYDFVPVPQ